MNRIFDIFILMILFAPTGLSAASDEKSAVDKTDESIDYVSVTVDHVMVDTDGLAIASETLAESIDGLALAIDQLSADSAALTDEQKQTLLSAVTSAHEASVALTELARQLPQSAQDFSERLPQIISDAGAPLAKISSSLESVSNSVMLITESLPQATENATLLVDSALDSALQRFILYTIILIAIVALALIGIMWFIYRQYIGPLTRKLDEVVGAPEHFEQMALHMKGTSGNLLALQQLTRQRGADRYRHR
jgi:hypothetical protein